MIKLRWKEDCQPQYMTAHSAACDLKARTALQIEPGEVGKVPAGVWIDSVSWEKAPQGTIPELQVRARSGLAYKHSIMLANGLGTVDADYPDEICVLLYNGGRHRFTIEPGMRIGQLTLGLVQRISGIPAGGQRTGGFGSTNT